jgi:hypothetical protein
MGMISQTLYKSVLKLSKLEVYIKQLCLFILYPYLTNFLSFFFFLKKKKKIGMDLEGIYRKNGGSLQMRAIISAFEKGENIDLDDPDQFNDISAVTSVFKQYLRDLPNPLFTYELYSNFLELVRKST